MKKPIVLITGNSKSKDQLVSEAMEAIHRYQGANNMELAEAEAIVSDFVTFLNNSDESEAVLVLPHPRAKILEALDREIQSQEWWIKKAKETPITFHYDPQEVITNRKLLRDFLVNRK